MGRRRKEAFWLDNAFELFKMAPVWVGPVLALLAFGFLRYVIPLILSGEQFGFDPGLLWKPILSTLSWVVGGAVLLAWVAAEAWKLSNRRLLNAQTGADSIRDLSWRAFERLVSEAYRRQGYIAEVVGNANGDGGMDIRLTGEGETVLVQCKQWRTRSVGVTTVRELLGVVTSERATRGILITSGRFTREARSFARANGQIELVDGPELDGLVKGVQASQGTATAVSPLHPAPSSDPRTTTCPACGSRMVLRTARRGANAGKAFWGCETYPRCRGTRDQAG